MMRGLIMKHSILAVMAVWAFTTFSLAGLPVQDFSLTSIGIDYTGLWRGETITERTVPAHENTHHIGICYSPVKYAAFSLGLGIANYTVDTVGLTQFKGTPGISPSFGLSLYTPMIGTILKFAAHARGYYLYCENKSGSHQYSGPFLSPSVGPVFSITDKLDIEAGARGLLIFGEMSRSGESTASYFSNNDRVRGYLSVILHSPFEGAYCVLDFDASPSTEMDWENGPFESSISLKLGFILRTDKRFKKTATGSTYPAYEDLKKKLDDMEKEMK
jgi:hypothetical protein